MREELIEKINKLKKERNAIILAHNYQIPEIQDIADFCGDSLGMSIQASKTDADVIICCGVEFMAETASILCPDKKVLLPVEKAGCSMADMIDAIELSKLKRKHPDALVVTYVNSTAEVKAESDYCCTSSNAKEVINALPSGREIIFGPDRNLGQYVQDMTGRKLILWPGFCEVHMIITDDNIIDAKAKWPDAVVLVHPECNGPVKKLADIITSTGGMLDYVKKSDQRRFIVATETGIIHTMKTQNPDKKFMAANKDAICVDMKRIHLEDIVYSLESLNYEIKVETDTRIKARSALDKMISILPAA